MDIALFVSLGSVVVVGLGIILTSNARYFTIREYETYRDGINVRFYDILDRIKTLEQTRPTTGELKAWVTRQITNGKE